MAREHLGNPPHPFLHKPIFVLGIYTSMFSKDPRRPFKHELKAWLPSLFLPKASHTWVKLAERVGTRNKLAHNTSPTKNSLPVAFLL